MLSRVHTKESTKWHVIFIPSGTLSQFYIHKEYPVCSSNLIEISCHVSHVCTLCTYSSGYNKELELWGEEWPWPRGTGRYGTSLQQSLGVV